jgi:hypothetical protein
MSDLSGAFDYGTKVIRADDVEFRRVGANA